ncbi:hypothetical protein UFOVP120_67 [uncultured Caudovirales phage]|uniref:Putative phage tail fibre C-terminal domain-containing protein n=1 Tax=uncultured Caudovirales phage TaxID=2100421 RepID=A0A6J5LCX7_9CAUD|nr:hypothetical protein UFOVP120_67 [uncultured Caudovirales phage]
MTSTYTTNKHIEKPAYNDYASNSTGWSGPINTDWDIIDAAFGGVTIKNPTGISGTVALTASEYQKLILVFGTSLTGTATLTADIVYTLPAGVGGNWIVYNNTTGAFNITLAQASGGGTSIQLTQGARLLVYSDGTNVNFVAPNLGANSVTSTMLQPNSVTTPKIIDGAVTYAKVDTGSVATVAQFRAATASELLNANVPWDAAAFVTLSDASSIAIDMATGFNFQVTIAGNRTLANPTNPKVGQSGVIIVAQDSTGGYTLGFGTSYKFANATAPTISTTANSVNMLFYYVYTSSFILINNIRGVA